MILSKKTVTHKEAEFHKSRAGWREYAYIKSGRISSKTGRLACLQYASQMRT